MKQSRRLVILTIIFTLTIVAGCSNKSTNAKDGKIELTFWSLFGGGDGEYMKAIIKDFNELQSEIVVKNVDLEFEEFYPKLMAAVTAGNGPDMAITHTSKLPELVNEGIVQELDSIADRIEFDWDQLNDNILSSAMIDGEHYAVPIDTHPYVMYFNKTILAEAGLLDEDGKPIFEESPEGFIDFTSTLQEKIADQQHVISMPYKLVYPYRLWWSFYHQLGGKDLIGNDLKTLLIDMDKAVEAADYMKGFYESNVFSPNMEPNDAAKSFQSGNAALLFDGVWTVGAFSETENLDFGVMSVPEVFNESATWGDSHTIILPIQNKPDEEREAAAMEFSKWVVDHGHDWAKAGHIPSKKGIADDADLKALPHRSEYIDVADIVAFPKTSPYNWTIQNEMIRHLDTVWAGAADPQEAIENAIKVLEKNMD
ncbi:ABC transporter substrate-binding protein [Lederbergia galactosidilytica]|uniref:Uncharacterized protein n=1 Tax=Lederbergia galactosidilytica TaxID=217031 RepID=A0A178A5L8_9BACI|nr:ABC transporter substrate-binding protein [Lederbergia galactosidilytica]OAK75485.1 hypothetical protein ABB05_01905 [Lederbergia galactosidilytica]